MTVALIQPTDSAECLSRALFWNVLSRPSYGSSGAQPFIPGRRAGLPRLGLALRRGRRGWCSPGGSCLGGPGEQSWAEGTSLLALLGTQRVVELLWSSV